MDTLAAMRVFLAVVEEQGFTAASRVLGMPLPTVSRKITELESHLGAQLLIRSTRTVTVTDSGRRYYEDVRRILDELDDVQRQVSGEYQQPKGRLTITAPTFFGRLHVLPIVSEFLQAYREIDVQLHLTNYVVDLLEEQINLGIRIGTLTDSSIIAIEMGTIRQIVCASPTYLSRHGTPQSPNDLVKHQCISSFKGGVPVEWVFEGPSNRLERYSVQSRLSLNSIGGIVDTAVRDGGLAQLYSYQVAPHVAEGDLELVLTDYEIEPIPVYLVYPQGKIAPRKLRAFIDFAVPRIRECLAQVQTQCLS